MKRERENGEREGNEKKNLGIGKKEQINCIQFEKHHKSK